ncbi:MAG: hypothetical protein FJY86_01205 [Candidatus Diapherotrites archaeon]|uniref:Uncharacterized protein n=1 Tax=Candidatus Iainarchaeum sp. TaxID=3101447 RepID=A0A8T4C6Y8_9ARCH|nr:hypothetical protein [Candidatus Diapherotrites archaeon]
MNVFVAVWGVLVLFFIAGCVSPPSSAQNTTYAPVLQTQNTTTKPNRPGDAVAFCVNGTAEENQSCFATAFSACKKSLGLFWKTQDGFPLLLETLGLETGTNNCRVRISAADNDSYYYGQSTICSVPADASTASAAYSLSAITSSTCEGLFFSTLKQS